jgi:ferric-dicitrate binding protein FerR (iron transport regulator)
LNNIANTDKEWEKFENRIKAEQKKKTNVLTIYSRIAAILLLPVIGLGVFYFNASKKSSNVQEYEHFTVETPLGQKSKLVLPDSTVVWLNSGSQLTYNSFSKSTERKVNLSGEAYFEVKKDKKHPFIVSTKDYDIKVLGTKFNVKSYKDDNATETVLQEGKVAISFGDGKVFELNPGQVALASNSESINIENTNTQNIVCWKNNVLRFNNTSVKDMVPMLERWYGVHINVKNMNKVADKRYTMTIKTESLNEALQLIRYVTPIKYSVKGDNVEIIFLDI